jgi:DNA-binding transcriptional regulator YiaG
MPNLAATLKSEIVRLSSRAARVLIAPLQRSTTTHRRQIAVLRRQIEALEKELKLQRTASTVASRETPDPERVRFVPKGLASHRRRLGFSAEDYGRLLGVSGQSVYHWEAKKTTPRKEQIAAIAALRPLGKRQAMARLAMLPRKKGR